MSLLLVIVILLILFGFIGGLTLSPLLWLLILVALIVFEMWWNRAFVFDKRRGRGGL